MVGGCQAKMQKRSSAILKIWVLSNERWKATVCVRTAPAFADMYAIEQTRASVKQMIFTMGQLSLQGP
jgi:hypothetical protein